jgi:hypothetical protein
LDSRQVLSIETDQKSIKSLGIKLIIITKTKLKAKTCYIPYQTQFLMPFSPENSSYATYSTHFITKTKTKTKRRKAQGGK